MITRVDAIKSLHPGVPFGTADDEISIWESEKSQPTNEEIDAEVQRLQSEYDALQYQRDRIYPEIGEQLDMLWHAIDTGTLDQTSEFYTTLKAVKDANPKPV